MLRGDREEHMGQITCRVTNLEGTSSRNIDIQASNGNIHSLISRVRGPYGKLWTEFFPSFYGPSAERAGHENKEGKNEDP